MNVVGFGWFGDGRASRRFRAEHSQFEMVAEFIDCVGNALPLQVDVGCANCRGRAFAPIFVNYHRNLDPQMLYPLRCYR